MPAPDPLQTLARLYNLQTVYLDGLGQLRKAPPEAILSVLKSLGAAVESMAGVPGALRERHQALWQRAIEPVTVAWQDRPLRVKLRLPLSHQQGPITGEVTLENGECVSCRCEDAPDTSPLSKTIEGTRYVQRTLTLRAALPLGYHQLHLRADGLDLESFLFAAPYHAYAPRDQGKRWGLFCPTYALRSDGNWGAGDFADLTAFARFAGEMGGHAVATLPMLAGFLDEPFNHSPYAPASRLFWNEFYLDVTAIPELAHCPAAQAVIQSEVFRRELEVARSQSLVDYRKVMALKRSVIERILDFFLSTSSARRESFDKFVAARHALRDYAAFRAKNERERKPWPLWVEAERNGVLTPGAYDERAKLYHLYTQWLCEEQAGWLKSESTRSGVALYLDFPLGVNRDGYDVWRERDLFALKASGGAPPDGLFIKGQNWGFPPCRPDAMRREKYRYYRDCLRHHLAHASMLRIDHVMGLHRSFWVPEGFSAVDGLYMHGHAADYYAVLNLESHRYRVQIVGENLGTVPPYVDEALSRHGILGMHVGQFGVGTDPAKAIDSPPANTVTSLNTHDTATFMSFWTGADIEDRLALGSLNQEQARQEQGYRAAQRDALLAFLRSSGALADQAAAAAVLEAWLTTLAGGAEEFLLVNLEDLWLQCEPQNVPGTWLERPNWRRKARHGLDEIRARPEISLLLRKIGDIRRRIR